MAIAKTPNKASGISLKSRGGLEVWLRAQKRTSLELMSQISVAAISLLSCTVPDL